MSIEIPRGINLDKLIVPRFNLKVNQKKVALLESNKRLVYPVEFGIGDDIDSLEEGDRIPSFHFKIKEDNNSSVTFTIINARMFDWSILINRGEFISQDAINKINRHLRKGKLSRCVQQWVFPCPCPNSPRSHPGRAPSAGQLPIFLWKITFY